MVYVGLVTAPSTPSARHAPRTNVVLPAPSSPLTSTMSPGSRRAASDAPAALVWTGESVVADGCVIDLLGLACRIHAHEHSFPAHVPGIRPSPGRRERGARPLERAGVRGGAAPDRGLPRRPP